MNVDEFYIETKLDGERFMLHREENTFKYFSRGFVHHKSRESISLSLKNIIRVKISDLMIILQPLELHRRKDTLPPSLRTVFPGTGGRLYLGFTFFNTKIMLLTY